MKRLYYEDSYTTCFDAEVTSCAAAQEGRWLVTLDQTAFYPEGGGQPYDTGVLGEAKVLEVHDKGGEVVHTTDRPVEVGSRVSGSIDWDRRLRHMQNHSGEHILSGIIHNRFGYDNVGFHMGSEAVTIDFNGTITPEGLREAEAEANRLVYENVPIQIEYPSPEALKMIDYRSKKELDGDVRIVTIPRGDVCACCGTHVKSSGAIGLIKTIGMINYKGGVRISMLCGKDALEDYEKRLQQVTDISHILSAKADLVAQAVEKLKQEAGEKDFLIGRLYQQIFAARSAGMPDSEEPLCLFEENLSSVQLRQFCTMLYEQGKGSVVAVCSRSGDSFQYALGSGKMDLRPVSKQLNQDLEGRGGGSSLMVQGIWCAGEDRIREAIMDIRL